MNKDECKAKGGKFEDGKCLVPYKATKSKSKIKVSFEGKRSSILWLFMSLIIDAIGIVSYFFPGIGEMTDIIWAPISGILVYMMYGNTFAALTQTMEEILPFTDFIPTATLTWVTYFVKKKML